MHLVIQSNIFYMTYRLKFCSLILSLSFVCLCLDLNSYRMYDWDSHCVYASCQNMKFPFSFNLSPFSFNVSFLINCSYYHVCPLCVTQEHGVVARAVYIQLPVISPKQNGRKLTTAKGFFVRFC